MEELEATTPPSSSHDIKEPKEGDAFARWCLPAERLSMLPFPSFSSLFPLFRPLITSLQQGRILPLTREELCGATTCYLGALLLSLTQYGEIRNHSLLLTFVRLYLEVDYVLDDPISTTSSAALLAELSAYLQGSPPISPQGKLIVHLYEQLAVHPGVVPYLWKAFYWEKEGMTVQSDSTLPLARYREVAEGKGSSMVLLLQSLLWRDGDLPLSNEDRERAGELGAIVQLQDDLHDVQRDHEAGIITYATQCLAKEGNLDRYVKELVERIDRLPFPLFKTPLLTLIASSISYYGEFYSEELRKRTQLYALPFDIEERLEEWSGVKRSVWSVEASEAWRKSYN